jgi:hypothetical protein
MVEYAVILILVSIVVIVILLTMGKEIRNVFSNLACDQGWSSCTTPAVSPSPSPTTCPSLQAPTLTPEMTPTPVYTFTPSDFGSSKRVLEGSVIRLLFDCPQSQASYSSVSSQALVPILSGNGYVVFIASSVGDAQITGPKDHSANPPLWHIDVQVVAP